MTSLFKKPAGRNLLIGLVLALSFCGVLFIVSFVRIYRFYRSLPGPRPAAAATVEPGEFRPRDTPQELYLDAMKRILTRYGLEDRYVPLIRPQSRVGRLIAPFLKGDYLPLFWQLPFDPAVREAGKDWPRNAETMIGMKRLDNLQDCVTDVIRRNVPGDLIETGAWRGGACIFMRAVLKAYGDTGRRVWVADSFEGLPEPEAGTEDAVLWQGGEMAVSEEQVRHNFARYGLLDDQVRFLKGFFIDTLPTAPVGQLAVLRVDCDLYDSITQSLQYLYDKVSAGGYVIIDDYGALSPAKKAVDDFRKARGITDELKPIDWSGYFWQKQN